jgi:pyruvate/2-oxoglutarate dehydrogenase complex dihydrolipoamide dehydrogenase (E3) component
MEYDAIIIGSGQGGGPLAHKLADLDWKVALVEEKYLGGSCINYGCTPTKVMIASARVAHQARRGSELGIHVSGVGVDLAEVVERKNEIVLQWRQGQQEQAEKRPTLDLYRGHGRFSGPHSVEVNGQTLTSDHIFIDTGTRPRLIPIEGLDEVDYLTNLNVMDLTEVPERLLILGGSYLALEFGQMFRRFGSQVTVVELMDQIVPREDKDVAQALQEALAKEDIAFRLGAKASQVVEDGDGIVLTVEYRDGRTETVSGSHLLMAIGRTPNTDDLGLEAAGVETDDDGYVKVNDRLETNVPGVWAIGDVKGGPAFTHVSYDDHLVIYDNLINEADRTIDGRIIPYAVFTDPELGRVGMTEKAAREAGYRLKVGKIPMSWVARAIERGETEGLMKIVINADSNRILGAAILGSEGGELVQILMALMMADAPWTLFKQAMFIHPTMAEGFFTLMDNVEPV